MRFGTRVRDEVEDTKIRMVERIPNEQLGTSLRKRYGNGGGEGRNECRYV